jgi:hypothetical protein
LNVLGVVVPPPVGGVVAPPPDGGVVFVPLTIVNDIVDVATTVVEVELAYPFTVTIAVLADPGIPVICPVLLFNVNPVGNVVPTGNA